MPSLFPRAASSPAPGAYHVPDWLTEDQQAELISACVTWAESPGGLHRVKVRNGEMSVETVCLGWHWLPYRYAEFCEDNDGSPVKPFPSWLGEIGRAAVAATFGGRYEPDVALINRYGPTAKMGLHQDRDERSDAPVVSLSLGDSCVFRFGNTTNRGRPYTNVELQSGDLFVFGGPARLAFHGVPRMLPGASGGRWNITLRESGLSHQHSTPARG
jgi:DNA oxidative demethylase